MNVRSPLGTLFVAAILCFSAPQSVFAGNPVSPISPDDNVQDPGDPGTAWGGCGPADSNCYVTVTANTFENGLTETGGTVKFGGTLTEDTQLDLDGNELILGTGNTNMFLDEGQAQSGIFAGDGTAFSYLQVDALGSDPTVSFSLVSNSGTAEVSIIGQATDQSIVAFADVYNFITSDYGSGLFNIENAGGNVYIGDYDLDVNGTTLLVSDDDQKFVFTNGAVGIGTNPILDDIIRIGTPLGQTVFNINLETDNERAILAVINDTDDGSSAEVGINTTDTDTLFYLLSDFNDGQSTAYIDGTAEASGSRILYDADSHIFNGGVVINELGADHDFRIESVAETHALFLDAGTSQWVLNGDTPVNSAAFSIYGEVVVDGNFYAGFGDDGFLTVDDGGHARLGFVKKSGGGPMLAYGSASTFRLTQSSDGDIDAVNTFTDRLVVDVDGDMGVGDSTPDVRLDVENTATDGNIFALTDSDGACLHNPESGSEIVSCSSDERLKQNIRDAASALLYFNEFRIRDYEVIASGDQMTGVIAQEVLQTYPELVTTGPNGMYSVQLPDQWKVIKAIQELDLKIESMNALQGQEQNFFGRLTAWFGDVGNGISRIFTGEVCLTDENGDTECLTKDELRQIKRLLDDVPADEIPSGEENNDESSEESPIEQSNSDETDSGEEVTPQTNE